MNKRRLRFHINFAVYMISWRSCRLEWPVTWSVLDSLIAKYFQKQAETRQPVLSFPKL